MATGLAAAGWDVRQVAGRSDDLAAAGREVDAVVLAVPDGAIEAVAGRIEPTDAVVSPPGRVVGPGRARLPSRRAAVHPLVALPDAEIGARRLQGAWFAVAGDDMADAIVAALGGRSFVVSDGNRAVYHAAAVVASNHLVALMGQVERLGAGVGAPRSAMIDLARGSLDERRVDRRGGGTDRARRSAATRRPSSGTGAPSRPMSWRSTTLWPMRLGAWSRSAMLRS